MSIPGRAAQAYYGNWCNVHDCKNLRAKSVMNGMCNKHNHIKSKYGDPLQKKITLTAFSACEKKVQKWITLAKQDPKWDELLMDPLRRNLEAGAADVRFDLNLYLNGKAMRNGIRNALRILDAWHSNYTPEERLKFWLGIEYFYIHYPKSFASFEGYKAQVVQLMYRRSGIKIGKPKKSNQSISCSITKKYQALTVPRYMFEFVWNHLYEIFGAVAHHMNRKYNKEENFRNRKKLITTFFSKKPDNTDSIAHMSREIERIRKALYRARQRHRELKSQVA
jgi:hypothetical protein